MNAIQSISDSVSEVGISCEKDLSQQDEATSLFEQEFTEQDVLPFLLQAQDIISKLESRVVGLENDLSTVHKKYEHDRSEWLVGLSQKDQYITHLSSKLQKSDFNSKEVIVLLSDLFVNQAQMDEQTKSIVTLCLNYLRQTSVSVQQQPQIIQDDGIDDLEEGELERRQAAVSEWRHTDKNNNIPDRSSTDPAVKVNNSKACDVQEEEDPVQLIEDELSSSLSSCSSSSDKHLHSNNDSSMTLPTTYAVNDDQDHTSFCVNCKQLLSQLDSQVERHAYLKRDLSSLASALSEEEDIRSAVEQDKEILEQETADITSALFLSLNQILMDEVTDRDGIIQIHRETNGKLSQILDAWDTRDARLKQVKDLLVELDSVVHQSANASCTISHRYQQQQQQQINQQKSPALTPTTSNYRLTSRSAMRLPSLDSSSSSSSKYHDTYTIRIDGFVLAEFQHHIKSVLDSNTTPIPSTPFAKRVFIEDIEPCLFFPQSQGWWKSPWFKKKLVDAISKNKCEIQGWHDVNYISNITSTTTSSSLSNTTSPATSHISSSSQHSINSSFVAMPPKMKCACCNILRVCEFKMRLPIASGGTSRPQKQQHQQQPWLPIDRFCRDRLVAVCGYYNFMSHLRLVATSPILSIFKQVMQHRRKMSLARVGSIGLFDDVNGGLDDDDDTIIKRLSSCSNTSSKRQAYQLQRRRRRNRESIVLDHSGSGSDTGSVVSVSELQGLEGTLGQIVIVH
ncbi:hypothetical protein BD408DRAFT_482075 [Parasitella parasitica]|nr:hypothetical protein BD408DRAFT_482075 [Parasitella parasitica]